MSLENQLESAQYSAPVGQGKPPCACGLRHSRIRARMGERLWLVGDSVFPGESVLAVALGGVRVAGAVAATLADGARSGVRRRRV